MTAPAEDALNLRRPLPDGALAIVACGEKKDEAGELAGANIQLSRDHFLGIKNNRRLNKRGLGAIGHRF